MITRKLLAGVFSILLVLGLALSSCSSTPAAPSGATAGPYASGASSAPAAASGATKTVKVGVNFGLGWPLGIDGTRVIQLDIDKINSQGGLQIGPDKYKIQMNVDDNKMDPAVAKTAAQKEIFQDQVDFILGDIFADSYLDLANQNKKIVLGVSANDNYLDPKLQYTYQASFFHTTFHVVPLWFAEKNPGKKTVLAILPDNQDGHDNVPNMVKAAKAAGFTWLDPIFYPPNSTDLSAIGTKVVQLNPDIVEPMSGGPAGDSLVIKTIRAGGYKGQIIISTPTPTGVLAGIAGADNLEGVVSLEYPFEFNPPLNDAAATFRNEYTAKYGKWEDPEPILAASWYLLKAGMQKAGSIETEKVKAVLDAGLDFQNVSGPMRTVPRPDLKNSRAVESIAAMPVKKIVGGKAILQENLTIDQSYTYCKKIFGW
jgi:branched-chain amino acid transport system substrate-binding protein